MAANERAGVTPAGIRDGRSDVLRALVAARGSAVLAYCRAVCTPADASRAAAESFARFRAAVVDAPDLTGLDPDALLLGATRHAAASMARTLRGEGRADREQDTCAEVPGLLAARAAGFLGEEDAVRLDAHLERCPACRGLAADFERAEEAYRSATAVPVPPATERTILAALEAAAPVVADDAPPEASAAPEEPAPLEPEAPEAPENKPDEPAPLEPEDQVEPDEADEDDVDDVAPDDLEAEAAAEDEDEDDEHGDFEDDLDESGLYPDELHDHDDELDVEDHEPGPSLRERLSAITLPRLHLPRLPGARETHDEPDAPEVFAEVASPAVPGPRRDLRPIVLPALVVLAALVVTLAAAGVFGGDEPEPTRAKRQRPELRVEAPVTTPLPVEVRTTPPPATTTPATSTTPATTTPPAGTPTTPASTAPQGPTGAAPAP